MPEPDEPVSEYTGPIRITPGTEAGCEDPRATLSKSETSEYPLGAGHLRVRGYELLSVLGSGGMGIVYKARQTELERVVALKMLRGYVTAAPEFRERFHSEATAVAKLRHPNVIQVFEVGTVEASPDEEHPSPFMSLEYVDGGSLLKFTERPQAPQFAARLVEKVARGVQAAHDMGIVHRDLKPGNVLVTRDGEPKVADFGLAKEFLNEGDAGGRYLTRTGVVMGTPAYMAPEQAMGAPASPSFDVYSLGVILYELLTGRVPFHGATAPDTMYLVCNQEPVSPRQLQPSIPRDMETICLKCLEKSVQRRYPSAAALADDLARFLDGRPIAARPVGPGERAVRWARRNPAVAGLAAAVLVVGVAGLGGIVWQWSEARENARRADANAGLAGEEADKAKKEAKRAEAAADSERWERYRSNIAAAASALQLNNVPAAQKALEQSPVEYRGWEWHHFRAQLDGADCVLEWPGAVHALYRWSPDVSRVLVMRAFTDDCRVWDLRDRRELWTADDVRPFGQRGAYLGGPLVEKGTDDIRLRDMASNRTVATLRIAAKEVSGIEAGKDGRRIVTTGVDRTFRVWDGKTGEQLRVIPIPDTSLAASDVSDDGRRFLAVFNRTPKEATVWDLDTGKTVRVGPQPENIHGCQFTPGGDLLLTVDRFPGTSVRVWDARTGALVSELKGHENVAGGLVVSPDRTRIISSSQDLTTRVWEIASGKQLFVLKGHREEPSGVDWSPDGKRIVTSSNDASLRIWDAQTGENLALLRGHVGRVLDVRYRSNEEIASIGVDGTVRLWSAADGERNGFLRGHTGFVYGVAFHPDGERVASVSWDGTVRLWEATTGRQLWSRKLAEEYGISVAFPPDGKRLAASSRSLNGNGRVQMFAVENGNEAHSWSLPLRWPDTRLSFDRTGDLLAVGTLENGVRLWDTRTHAEAMSLMVIPNPVQDMSFSPDNRLLAVAQMHGPDSFRIWDLTTRKEVQVLRGHTDHGRAVTFSHDGRLLATAADDNTVRLWDTETWKQVGELKHGTKVYQSAFTPDGRRLACGCANGAIHIWDLSTRAEVAELRQHSKYVHSLAFSPDGTRLVSGSGDFTLRVWDTKRPVERPRPRGAAGP